MLVTSLDVVFYPNLFKSLLSSSVQSLLPAHACNSLRNRVWIFLQRMDLVLMKLLHSKNQKTAPIYRAGLLQCVKYECPFLWLNLSSMTLSGHEKV